MTGIDPLIARLYRATAEVPAADFRRWALETVRSELPFDAAIWGTGHESTLQFHTHTTLDVDPSLFDDLLAHRHINPISQFFFVDARSETPVQPPRFGQAVAMSDLMPDEDFFSSAIYQKVFKPRGISRILSSLHLHERSGIFTLLSLYRFDAKHRFSDQEKAQQQQLLFHLLESERHAFYLRLQSERMRTGEHFALVDSQGIYQQMDSGFLDLLEHYVPPVKPGVPRLPFTLQSDTLAIKGLRVRFIEEGELMLVGIHPEHPLDQLTEREWDVVNGVSSGKTFKTIARELALSPSTVANHLYRVYNKLGINSRNELLALCESHSASG